jgi:hypothetical protein
LTNMPGTEYVAQVADVDIKWKVSLAVSTNDVRSLNEPMVTMMLVTTDEDGSVHNRSVELTLAKFRELFAALKQVHVQMEHASLL